MESVENRKTKRAFARIVSDRKLAQEIRWRMLLHVTSTKKMPASADIASSAAAGSGNEAYHPNVDAEISETLYSYLKDILTEQNVFDDQIADTLSSTEIMGKFHMISRSCTNRDLQPEVQMQLAFLWRTFSILKNIDDGSINSSLQQFYKEIAVTLDGLAPLVLSSMWSGDSDLSNDPADEGLKEKKVLPFQELSYLHDTDNYHDEHDPCGIIKRFFDTITHYSLDSADCVDKTPAIAVCLGLAVKSARASLLLKSVCLLLDFRSQASGVDFASLKDLIKYATKDVADVGGENAAGTGDRTSEKDDTRLPLRIEDAIIARNAAGHMLLSFGRADHGKLGHADVQIHRLVPTVVESLQHVPIVKVSSMSTHSIAIDRMGNAYIWGALNHGYRGDMLPRLLEGLPPKTAVIDIACGHYHALFLSDSGKVFSTGSGANGRLGLGTTADQNLPALVSGLANEMITTVACGASHSLALTDSGNIYCWGKNSQGQCGLGTLDDLLKPALNNTLQPYVMVQIAGGWEHSIALTSGGSLYAWGCGYKDSRRGIIPPVLGLGGNDGRVLPEHITSLDGVEIVKIACGWDHCLALDINGKLLSWGSGQNGKLGQGNEENVAIPCYIPALENVVIEHISAGCEHSAAISQDGVVYTWGHGDGGRLGHGDNVQYVLPTVVPIFKQMNVRPMGVCCGDKFTMALVSPDDAITESGRQNTRKESLATDIDAVPKSASVDPFKPSTEKHSNLRQMNECWFQKEIDRFLGTQQASVSHEESKSLDRPANTNENEKVNGDVYNVDVARILALGKGEKVLTCTQTLLILLAMMARAPGSKKHSSSADSTEYLKMDAPYKIECHPYTFAQLLNLLEVTSGDLMASCASCSPDDNGYHEYDERKLTGGEEAKLHDSHWLSDNYDQRLSLHSTCSIGMIHFLLSILKENLAAFQSRVLPFKSLPQAVDIVSAQNYAGKVPNDDEESPKVIQADASQMEEYRAYYGNVSSPFYTVPDGGGQYFDERQGESDERRMGYTSDDSDDDADDEDDQNEANSMQEANDGRIAAELDVQRSIEALVNRQDCADVDARGGSNAMGEGNDEPFASAHADDRSDEDSQEKHSKADGIEPEKKQHSDASPSRQESESSLFREGHGGPVEQSASDSKRGDKCGDEKVNGSVAIDTDMMSGRQRGDTDEPDANSESKSPSIVSLPDNPSASLQGEEKYEESMQDDEIDRIIGESRRGSLVESRAPSGSTNRISPAPSHESFDREREGDDDSNERLTWHDSASEYDNDADVDADDDNYYSDNENDLWEMQQAILSSMEASDCESALRMNVSRLRRRFEPRALIPRLREVLERAAEDCFEKLGRFGLDIPGDDSENKSYQRLNLDRNGTLGLGLLEIWWHVQDIIYDSFDVLYSVPEQRGLLMKAVLSPEKCTYVFPAFAKAFGASAVGLGYVIRSNITTEDIIKNLEYGKQYFTFDKLHAWEDHSVPAGLCERMKASRDLVAARYFSLLQSLITVAVFGASDAELGSTEAKIIQPTDSEGDLSLRNLLASLRDAVDTDLKLICQHLAVPSTEMLDGSLAGCILSMWVTLMSKNMSLRVISMLLPLALYLQESLKGYLSLARKCKDKDIATFLESWISGKMRWLLLLVASTTRTLTFPAFHVPLLSSAKQTIAFTQLFDSKALLRSELPYEESCWLSIFDCVNTFTQGPMEAERASEDGEEALDSIPHDLLTTFFIHADFALRQLFPSIEFLNDYSQGEEVQSLAILVFSVLLKSLTGKNWVKALSLAFVENPVENSKLVVDSPYFNSILVAWLQAYLVNGLLLESMQFAPQELQINVALASAQKCLVLLESPISSEIISEDVLAFVRQLPESLNINGSQSREEYPAWSRKIYTEHRQMYHAYAAHLGVSQVETIKGRGSSLFLDDSPPPTVTTNTLVLFALYVGCDESIPQTTLQCVRQELFVLLSGSALRVTAKILDVASCSPSCLKYFCSSLQLEYEGRESMFDWLPSLDRASTCANGPDGIDRPWDRSIDPSPNLKLLLPSTLMAAKQNAFKAYTLFDDALGRILSQICGNQQSSQSESKAASDTSKRSTNVARDVQANKMVEAIDPLLAASFNLTNIACFMDQSSVEFDAVEFTGLKQLSRAIEAFLSSRLSGTNTTSDMKDTEEKDLQVIQVTTNLMELAQKRSYLLHSAGKVDDYWNESLRVMIERISVVGLNAVYSYSKLIHILRRLDVTYLLPVQRNLEVASVSVHAGAFTPCGSYFVGFWLYLPDGCKMHENHRLHVLSRMPEITDANMISLVTNTTAFACNPSIILEADDEGIYMLITVTVQPNTSQNAAKDKENKSGVRLNLKSKILQTSTWLFCSVHVAQTTQTSTVTLPTKADSFKVPKKVVRRDKTTLSLCINGDFEGSVEAEGGKTQLFQNVIIGAIPSTLFESESRGLLIADVFWISNPGKAMENLGDPARLSEQGCLSLNKMIYEMLDNRPPALLNDKIALLWSCAAKQFKVLSHTYQPHQQRHTLEPPAVDLPKISMISRMCSFVLNMIVVGDEATQEAAFQTLYEMVHYSAMARKQLGTLAKTSRESEAISSALVSVRQTLSATLGLWEALIHHRACMYTQRLETPRERTPSIRQAAENNTDYQRIWWLRMGAILIQAKPSLSSVSDTGDAKLFVSENLFCTSLAKCIAAALAGDVVDQKFMSQNLTLIEDSVSRISTPDTSSCQRSLATCQLISAMCGGGWLPVIGVGRAVELVPRALFMQPDSRGLDQVLYPSSANVLHTSLTRPGIWLQDCPGTFFRAGGDTTDLVPRSPLTVLPSTEMTQPLDMFKPILMDKLVDLLPPLASADKLTKHLRKILISPNSLKRLNSESIFGGIKRRRSTSQFQSQFMASPLVSKTTSRMDLIDGELVGTSQHIDPVTAIVGEDVNKASIALAQTMSQLRCLLVQWMHLDELAGGFRLDQFTQLSNVLRIELGNIIAIANLNPVSVISGILDSSSVKASQLDDLKSILKEGDTAFLERIALRFWREAQKRASKAINRSMQIADESFPVMVPFSGDVAISGTKVRAIVNFPTVRLPNVTIEPYSGRWFYECTLLSDGLMQIGWADALFRCDPVCGQGVGDHAHSWAYDGLRSKRWNVSCEAYGRRWRQGDVVGVLIDMDLLEMRYFLNGEDLGPAFVDFNGADMFPALSLNGKNSLRVNFGQCKFMFPPDEVDGKVFKPVLAANAAPKKVVKEESKQLSDMNNIDKSKSISNDTSVGGNGVLQAPSMESNGTSLPSPIVEPEPNADIADRADMASAGSASFEDVDKLIRVPSAESAGHGVEGNIPWESQEGRGFLNEEEEDDDDDDECEGDENGDESGELELQRQAMVENLIGMGFPVDWALRAAEHCAASESSAIQWIIERMDLEQSKMEDIEGDSSRAGDEEEFEDGDDGGLEFLMQRHAAAMGAAAGSFDRDHGGLQMRGMPGGYRGGIGGQSSSASIFKNDSKQSALYAADLHKSSKASDLQLPYDMSASWGPEAGGPWNADHMYPPLLVGHYVAGRKQDSRKQEYLTQLQEFMGTGSTVSVITCCQFALCITYARSILLKVFGTVMVDDADFSDEEAPSAPSKTGQDFRDYVLQTVLGESSSSQTLRLMKWSFRQFAPLGVQPERLFPCGGNGTAAGEQRDQVLCIEPFHPGKGLLGLLPTLLSHLESCLLPASRLASASSEVTVHGLRSLSTFLDQIMRQASLAAEGAPGVQATCSKFLMLLVSECVGIIEAACNDVSPSKDWISAVLESGDFTDFDDFEGAKDSGAALSSVPAEIGAHSVMWAYNTLRSMLTSQHIKAHIVTQNPNSLGASSDDNERRDRPDDNEAANDPFTVLLSASTLSKLLKASLSPNMSLKFCAFDLSSLILARVNAQLYTDKGMASESYSRRDSSEFPVHGYPELTRIQLAAEYYVSIAKEKRLLQIFGTRMKSESLHRRTFSRYTRSVLGFLLQWQLLRRLLGLVNQNLVHQYHTEHWAMTERATFEQSADKQETSALSELENPENGGGSQSEPAVPMASEPPVDADLENVALTVTQVFPTSIAVSWNLPEKYTKHGVYGLYITPASNTGLDSPTLILGHVGPCGCHRIDDLDSDTLYKINLCATKSSPSPQAGSEGADRGSEGAGANLGMDGDVGISSRSGILPAMDDSKPSVGLSSNIGRDRGLNTGAGVLLGSDPVPTIAATDAADVPASGARGPNTNQTNQISQGASTKSDLDAVSAMDMADSSLEESTNSALTEGPAASLSVSMSASVAGFAPASSESAEGVEKEKGLGVGVGLEEKEDQSVTPVGGRPHVTLPNVSILAATEAEPTFALDADHMSPNLVMGSNHLTLRNAANKKWSSGRGRVKLTSGWHRWDVHIDRCVSKNIFIGVITSEAKLDNYVGCDRYGWGFLANKAVWHNKAKSKSYGELFRTGDTVSVVLDLDVGTLSFSLNGRDLGVAIDGLTSPLYPAFSLYNEDDQISILPPRGSVESVAWRASAAERVLDRLDMLQNLQAYFLACYSHTYNAQDTFPGREEKLDTLKTESPSRERREESLESKLDIRFGGVLSQSLLKELYKRLQLWEEDVHVRSRFIRNDFISMVSSRALCLSLSRGRLAPKDTFILERQVAVVLGVGYHRLWVQMCDDGDILGFTRDTLTQLSATGVLECVPVQHDAQPSEQDLRELEDADGRPMAAAQQTPQMPRDQDVRFSNGSKIDNQNAYVPTLPHEVRADVKSSSPCHSFSLGEFTDFVERQSRSWTAADDELLTRWIDVVARKLQKHPTALSYSSILACRDQLTAPMLDAKGGKLYKGLLEFQDDYAALFRRRTDEDIMIRSVLLIHMNDLLQPLLPFISPEDRQDAQIHPSAMLAQLAGLTFEVVKHEYAAEVSSLASSSLLPISMSNPNPAADEESAEQCKVDLELEVEEEDIIQERLLQLAAVSAEVDPNADSAGEGSAVAASRVGSILVLRSDACWKLLVSFQASLLGQLHAYVETLPHARYTFAHPQTVADNASCWENVLRRVCPFSTPNSAVIDDQNVPPKDRPVPFRISAKAKGSSRGFSHNGPSPLFDLLALRQKSCTEVSDWVVFDTFVRQAFSQVQNLIDLYFESASDSEAPQRNGNENVDSALGSHSTSALEKLRCITAAEVNLLLQMLHFAGALLGLAMRANVSVQIKLPNIFHTVFASSSTLWASTDLMEAYLSSPVASSQMRSSTASSTAVIRFAHQVEVTAALVMRRGMLSIFPEAALSLLRQNEFKTLLSAERQLCTSLHLLRRCAEYSAELHADEVRVKLFWVALSELSTTDMWRFLRLLWVAQDLPDEVYFTYMTHLPAPFRIVNADDAMVAQSNRSLPGDEPNSSPLENKLILCPEMCAIAIPKLYHLETVSKRLLELLS